ncbi:hypothetical protein EV193_101330 [Herbihabitans rhizosphaerae]|uniref:Uncharacterized protein n=1 Tax=Herbihabitans rhizosphaerae TaxID=1872711 RepID=A0A4Q7L5A5_9PSEU|nr:hypothetical protein EV193_101330 [Herbihabitans rhizosphaerae]
MSRRRGRRRGRPQQIAVKLKLPFLGEISGTWEPDQAEVKAAWELYVELVTRVTVVELRPNEGLVREALTSFYSMFEITRTILRKYGPALARPHDPGQVVFGEVAVRVLDGALRPLLSRWHPALMTWESKRPEGTDPATHERNWERHDELREELAKTRVVLSGMADMLAAVANIAPLHPQVPDATPPQETAGGGAPLAGDPRQLASSRYNSGRETLIGSCVVRAITTTTGSFGSGFSSRCGTFGGTRKKSPGPPGSRTSFVPSW